MLEDCKFWFHETVEPFKEQMYRLGLHSKYLVLHIFHILVFVNQ